MTLVLPVWRHPAGQKGLIWPICGWWHRERVKGSARAAGLLQCRCLCPRKDWPLPVPDFCASQSPGLGRGKQLAFEGHPKLLFCLVFFPFLFLFHSFPPHHFPLLSAASSSSITQTPNTSEEAIQLNLSWLQLAPEWKVSSVREGEACARRSRSSSAAASSSPHLPSLMIPNGQSLPSRERDALKHHCGRERSISGVFFKKKMIMITRGHNVSQFAVPLGRRARSVCQRWGEAWRGSGKPLPPTEPT